MLDTPGDLIPVVPAASTIPWTRRRSQILNFLHRGPVSFTTLVYDTNVGDISPLSRYFNPQRISEKDLNCKFGQYPVSGGQHPEEGKKIGSETVLMPRLLLYPERSQEQRSGERKDEVTRRLRAEIVDQDRFSQPEKQIGVLPQVGQDQVQRTINWVLSQDKSDIPDTLSQEFTRTNSSLPDLFHGTINSNLSPEDPLLDLRQTWTVPSNGLSAALEMEGKWSSLDSCSPW